MVTLTLLGLGCGQDGPIGPGTSAIVEPPAEPSWAVAAMGVFNGCALTTDGQPHCWGHYAALPGQGGPSAVASVATPVPESSALSAITVGGGVACGLDGAGVAFCWGWEISGELGDGGARNGETDAGVRGPERVRR